MHTGSTTDSGYASVAHHDLEHVQNARSEDHKRITEEVQSQISMNEENTFTFNNTSQDSEDSMDLQSDDARTVYSDASSIPALKTMNYISELAEDLFSKVPLEKCDDKTRESAFEHLPELLKAFALKVGYNASSQMHRDVMFFVHKHRR